MLSRYPLNAITVKTIDQFSYDTYSAISVNMLKYNHDTSASIRLLSSLINTSREVLEDLPYQINFKLRGFDFTSIDRMNAYYWPNIINFISNSSVGDTNILRGYSVYTGSNILMYRVEKQSDFIRHSLPADVFLGGPQVWYDSKSEYILSPYIKEKMAFNINNSQITIRPLAGFTEIALDSSSSAKITISGLNIRGQKVSEDINIIANIDYVTDTEWKCITGILATNISKSVRIMLYPYINGEVIMTDELIIDRQQFDPGICILTVDKIKQELVYSILREDTAEYPLGYNLLKTVPLSIPLDHTILSYYIDTPNKLLYATYACNGNESNVYLSCFPLIIPSYPRETLDNKTDYQSLSIEYEEDCVNEEWNLWLYPTSKTNDVESCNITINGAPYMSGLLLDLYKFNIETNRITIPFSDLYDDNSQWGTNNGTALIDIETYGLQQSRISFALDRPNLVPLAIKPLNDLLFNNLFPLADEILWTRPTMSSTNVSYKLPADFVNTIDPLLSSSSDFELLKLSGQGNVLFNGYAIINIFNTFYADETNKLIITSDTITHLQGADLPED